MNLQNEVIFEKKKNLQNSENIENQIVEDDQEGLLESEKEDNRNFEKKRKSKFWNSIFTLNQLRFKDLAQAIEESKNKKKENVCMILSFNIPSDLHDEVEEKLNQNNVDNDFTNYVNKEKLNETRLNVKFLKKEVKSILKEKSKSSKKKKSPDLKYFIFSNEDLEFYSFNEETTSEEYLKIVNSKLLETFHFEKIDEVKTIQLENMIENFQNNLSSKINDNSDYKIKDFNRIFLDSLITFIINIIIYFTELECIVYFDPFNYLNVEFYGSNEALMNFAEKESYPLQLKLNSNLKIINSNKSKNKSKEHITEFLCEKSQVWKEVKNIQHKNTIPFEKINTDDVSFFPPYMRFNKNKVDFYRRYNNIDEFHDCEYIRIIKELDDEEKENLLSKTYIENEPILSNFSKSNYICKDNECSIFRSIDKVRLINMSISSIINLDKLKNNKFFNKVKILRNDDLNEKLFEDSNFLNNYFKISDNSYEVKKNNQFIRNYLGETMSYYFLFISHYMKWLIFPTILGISISVITLLFQLFHNESELNDKIDRAKNSLNSINLHHHKHKNYFSEVRTYFNLLYICIIVIWGCLFTKSWASKQKFYNYIWGMTEYECKTNEISEVKINKFMLFQGVKIPIKNTWSSIFKRCVTVIITFFMILLTIAINIFLFYLSDTQAFGGHKHKIHKQLNSTYDSINFTSSNFNLPNNSKVLNNSNNEVTSSAWYYFILIFSVVLRNLLSAINYNVATWSCYYESHIKKENYEDSFIVKVTSFEFVNYYMTFFYVAYFKQIYGKCTHHDCFTELGDQLIVILITSNILNLLEIGIPFLKKFSRTKFLKNFVNEKLKSDFKENDPRVTSYYKDDFYETMTYDYIQIIFSYGYVILFGVTSPICFALAFIYIFIQRLIDSYKLIKLHNVTCTEGSHGIGIILKILKIFTFFGIITNTTITLFTIDFMKSSYYKWPLVFIVENIMVFVLLSTSFNSSPQWFSHIDQVKFNYIRRVLDSNNKMEKNEKENKTSCEVGKDEVKLPKKNFIKNLKSLTNKK
jgi:hypothetical protein